MAASSHDDGTWNVTNQQVLTFVMLLQKGQMDGVHGTVLEPCKISVHVDMAQGSGDVHLRISDVHIRVSPDVIELGASLQASVLEPLIQPSADRSVNSFHGTEWIDHHLELMQLYLNLVSRRQASHPVCKVNDMCVPSSTLPSCKWGLSLEGVSYLV